MAGLFKKAMGFIGLPIEDDEEVKNSGETLDFEPEKPSRKETKDSSSLNPKKNKVISVHTTTQLKVVVRTPLSFENAKDIADHLKAKKPVVINLENVDVPVAMGNSTPEVLERIKNVTLSNDEDGVVFWLEQNI